MARRFGRFNKNQPRDRNGRWTSKGGGSKGKSRPKTVSNKEYRGRATSNAIGAAASFAVGQPLAGSIYTVGVATNAYRLGSRAAARRVASSNRLTAAQKRTFAKRRKKADAFVGRVEKAQSIALAGSFAFGFAAQAAGLVNASRAAQASRLANGPLQIARTALKAKRPGRGGVYNITTMSGRKVK